MNGSEPAAPAPVARKMLSAQVDTRVIRELQARAAEEDRSALSLVRAAIKAYLAEGADG